MTNSFPHRLPEYDPAQDPIEIAAYDSGWPEKFDLEKRALRHALGYFSALRIEHFGSTAVPGLAAKPVIDLMVGVAFREDWPKLLKPIEGLGYLHWSANPKTDEMFFVKGLPPYGKGRTHHLHVYELEGPRWKKELAFRDFLRTHEVEAMKYEALKRELAARFTFDREAYTEGKSGFIQRVLSMITPG